jgi:N-acetylneuraminic acid mutarotase
MLPSAPGAISASVLVGFDSAVIAVWDGREMLIVGKKRAAAPTYCKEIGAAYAPATNTWRTLPAYDGAGGCLDPITWDRGVWTGKELLLWGTTNAAFNPSTNAWRALPDPPTWGDPAFAVWTGRQMIGWGGGGGDLLIDEGAAYTPSTNTWKRLPPAPLAGDGRLTTGVWTGSEVIVVGGEAAGRRSERFYADVAAYDPRTNQWRRLAPMPVGLSGTAVWDGTDVLVVNAQTRDPSNPYRTHQVLRGLAYDPITDSWRWLSAIEYSRDGAATVWTGHELVVWGGTVGDTIPPHGETYDPSTDEWSAMPRSPLRARYAPVAVWTGTSVLFWGGQDARNWNRLSDGAGFRPAIQ